MFKITNQIRWNNWDVYTRTVLWSWGKIENDGEIKQITSYTSCRDYMTDTLYKDTLGSIDWNKTVANKTTDKTALILGIPQVSIDNLKKNLPIIHKYEKRNKFKLTEIHYTNKNDCVVVIGSKLWQKDTFALSAYLMLLRCMTLNIQDQDNWENVVKSSNINESTYFKDIGQGVIDHCLNNIRKISTESRPTYKHGWKKEGDAGHGNSCIVHITARYQWLKKNPMYKTDKLLNIFDFKSNLFATKVGELLKEANL